MDCLFCKIVASEIPAHKLFEDERTLAFLDIFPGTEGHSLVIPKAHAGDLHEIAPEDLAAVMATAQRVGKVLERALGTQGLNLHQSNGEAAGQVIFHFHMHLLPRRAGDGLRSPWLPAEGEPAKLAALAERIRSEM
jgi:histidine triad (HIT) family protein